MVTQQLTLAHRRIGADQPPLVIAEIGINLDHATLHG